MKRRLALSLTFLLSACFAIHAQVTIGPGELPHNDTLLDLKENSAGLCCRMQRHLHFYSIIRL